MRATQAEDEKNQQYFSPDSFHVRKALCAAASQLGNLWQHSMSYVIQYAGQLGKMLFIA